MAEEDNNILDHLRQPWGNVRRVYGGVFVALMITCLNKFDFPCYFDDVNMV